MPTVLLELKDFHIKTDIKYDINEINSVILISNTAH
jgi:hypothetical protein